LEKRKVRFYASGRRERSPHRRGYKEILDNFKTFVGSHPEMSMMQFIEEETEEDLLEEMDEEEKLSKLKEEEEEEEEKEEEEEDEVLPPRPGAMAMAAAAQKAQEVFRRPLSPETWAEWVWDIIYGG
jgi:hypothetical protein